MRTRRAFSLLASGALVMAGALVAAVPASASHVQPSFINATNPTCADVGYDFEYKVEPPNSGTYQVPGIGSVTVTADGTYFDWTSTFGIDAVLVKGGQNANLYVYDPPAESFGDTGLHSPINPNNGQPFGLSHISFCYDLNVVVTKTADTSLTRTWTWEIEKEGDQTDLLLANGQSSTVNYDVTVDASAADSDFAVTGTITVHNPAPVAAIITGVADAIDGVPADDLDCGVTFPYSLPAGQNLECTYEAALTDGTTRTNVATATTSGMVGSGSGSTAVDFSTATVTLVDECIDVDDDLYGPLGTICEDDLPTVLEYELDMRDFLPAGECGEFTVDNIAAFETNDSGTTGSSTWTVNVEIPCYGGCTLTQGYWKTHSQEGPAPYDDNWKNLPGGLEEETIFFTSGQTWHQVFWTPPAGNVYYNLAHQYMAAKLNILNGAGSTAAVDTAIAQAEAFFAAYTPAQAAGLKGGARNTYIQLASTLDQYNNGLIGPGHCSE